jgi:hypothetical protein
MHPLIALLLLICLAAAPATAQVTATKINAKIGTQSTTVVDNTLTSVLLGLPDDSQTAQAATNVEGPDVSVESTDVSALSTSAVGISSQWIGQSATGVAVIRLMNGGGQIDFHDEIAVTSPFLPDGTPVLVTFRFYASHTTMLLHTDGTTALNNAGVNYKFSGQLTNLVSFQNTLVISNVDHKYQTDFGLLGTQSAVGMMDPNVAQVDFAFPSFVGETIDLAFRLNAVVSGGVFSTGAGFTQVNVGSGIGAVGLAFGASPAIADVDLGSQTFGGPFPTQAMANLANAQSAMPAMAVPVPTLSLGFRFLLVASMSALMLWGWRRQHSLAL